MKTLHKEQWSALESAARKADMELARLNAALASEQAKAVELAEALGTILANVPLHYTDKEACDSLGCFDWQLSQARQALSRAGGAR